jgi:hypothetical protein
LDLSYSSSARLTIGEPPPPVRLIRDFVNTAEPQLGTDQLVPLTAAERLERLGLVTPDARLAATDLPPLVGVREGLREVLRDALDVPSFVAVWGETTPSVLRLQRAMTS